MPHRRFVLACVVGLLICGLITSPSFAKKGGGGKPTAAPADITYIRFRTKDAGQPTNEAALMVMQADGSDARVVLSERLVFTVSGFSLRRPAWSPDGTKIAFEVTDQGGDDPAWGIHVVNADGSGQTQLTYRGGHPAWSPDGTQIAYSLFDSGTSTVHLVNADGTNDTVLVPGARPAWSADGSRLAYVANGNVHVIDLASGADTNVTVGGPLESWSPQELDWAKTQDKIAVAAVEAPPHACAGDPRNATCYVQEIWIIDLANPSSATNLTNTPDDTGFPDAEMSPTWSADDARIYFTRAGDIFVIDADGTNEQLVRAGSPPGKWTNEQLKSPDHKR